MYNNKTNEADMRISNDDKRLFKRHWKRSSRVMKGGSYINLRIANPVAVESYIDNKLINTITAIFITQLYEDDNLHLVLENSKGEQFSFIYKECLEDLIYSAIDDNGQHITVKLYKYNIIGSEVLPPTHNSKTTQEESSLVTTTSEGYPVLNKMVTT